MNLIVKEKTHKVILCNPRKITQSKHIFSSFDGGVFLISTELDCNNYCKVNNNRKGRFYKFITLPI